MNFKHSLERAIGIPFTEGNKVRILKNGDQIFDAMLSEVRNASQVIDFLTFVYWKGDIAKKFAHALAEKAKEGLKVRVLLDAFGALPMEEELVQMMKDSGADVVHFRPLTRWKVWKTDNRTHRKILICDNKVAFTGGVGIAKEWEGNARNPGEWRDTHFRITGPAVEGIKSAFIENWIEAGNFIDEFFDDEKEFEPHDGNGTLIQTISTAATVRWSDIMLLYQSLISLAKESINITTAYLNPDAALIKLLTKAAKRGVKVQIIIPGKHTDKRVSRIAAEDRFEDMLDAGIEIYYYQKTMMHAKVITVDGKVSCVGSANFNQRSMLKDDEINLVMLDEEITSTLNGHIEEDLKACEKVKDFEWKKRSVFRRGLETMVKPFKQQM